MPAKHSPSIFIVALLACVAFRLAIAGQSVDTSLPSVKDPVDTRYSSSEGLFSIALTAPPNKFPFIWKFREGELRIRLEDESMSPKTLAAMNSGKS